jgi:hypothetical protein
MHDQPIPTPAEQDDEIDSSILGLLTDCPVPWSAEEVAREIGDAVGATDGLGRLARAGLVHRLDGFVFATRAAVRGQRLAL